MERCLLCYCKYVLKSIILVSYYGIDVTILLLFVGCIPNITRNAIVNCTELVTYDMIKELILKYDLMTGAVPEQRNYHRT